LKEGLGLAGCEPQPCLLYSLRRKVILELKNDCFKRDVFKPCLNKRVITFCSLPSCDDLVHGRQNAVLSDALPSAVGPCALSSFL
jgi:hypothetical protein